MELGVETKPKQKKRATRRREPINLKATPVCCDLYSVENFDMKARKLVEEKIVLSDNDDEIETTNTNSYNVKNGIKCTEVFSTSPQNVSVDERVLIDSDEELNSSQQSRGSPSPPTPPPELEITQQRPSRQLTKVMQNVGQAVSNYRIQTFQEDPATPVVLIDDDSPSPKKQRKAIVVKIRSKSGLHRTVLQMEQNFENVFYELASKEGVNLNQIMLSRGEQIIRLTDTPTSINLQLAHILDCVIVETRNNTSLIEHVDEDEMIKVKVQGTGKTSSTTITIAKTSNFHKLLKQYSEFVGIPETRIKLSFDGDPINSNSTPRELDMEDDDVIDAIIT